MNLSDIHAGDEIEYECIVGRNNVQKSTGTVVQVSEKFISIQGKKYPDSILINDLKSGRAAIVGIKAKKVEEVKEVKFERPSIDILQKAKDESKSLAEVSEKLGVGKTTVFHWLNEVGISTRFTKKPVVKVEPKQETSCTEPVKAKAAVINKDFEEAFPKPVKAVELICCDDCGCELPGERFGNTHGGGWLCRECAGFGLPQMASPHPSTVPMTEDERFVNFLLDKEPEDDFTAEDDKPIPYKLVDPKLDEMKVIWIEDIMDNCMTAAVRLDYIAAIMGLEVGARR